MKKEKPKRPGIRGEKWELSDGRIVTVLMRIGTSPFNIAIYEVINSDGRLESVYESNFKRLMTGGHNA